MTRDEFFATIAELGLKRDQSPNNKKCYRGFFGGLWLLIETDDTDTFFGWCRTPKGGTRRIACGLISLTSIDDLRKLATLPPNERLMPNGHGPSVWLPC